MVRHYKMQQGHKRKRTQANCDKKTEEIASENMENVENKKIGGINEPENVSMKKSEVDDAKATKIEFGFPIFPTSAQEINSGNKRSVIFVIERASLEIAKVGKNYQLLDSSKHADFLRRNGRNPADYRPEIAHEAIKAVLDSSLNKYGQLKALYVKTEKGVLIEINPHVRIPRTYDRFAGLMLDLLQKLSVSAVGTREKLLRTVQNPVTLYFPADSLKIGFSSSEREVEIQSYVGRIGSEKPMVFVVGAMAHGKIDVDYIDEFIAIDDISRPARDCITLICEAVYRKWKRTL